MLRAGVSVAARLLLPISAAIVGCPSVEPDICGQLTETGATTAMTANFQSVFRDGLFAGHTAIVTGAGSGIGRCTAHELAGLGARVGLVGRRQEKLEAVAREIADAGGRANVYPADIREEERVREVVRAAIAEGVERFWHGQSRTGCHGV